MKTSIRQTNYSEVTLEYDRYEYYVDGVGQLPTRTIRTFRVNTLGMGYVREYVLGDLKQVCDGLSIRGSTLTASPETLLKVIRMEYRSMRRNEKKYC